MESSRVAVHPDSTRNRGHGVHKNNNNNNKRSTFRSSSRLCIIRNSGHGGKHPNGAQEKLFIQAPRGIEDTGGQQEVDHGIGSCSYASTINRGYGDDKGAQ
jgi:hypothetical protein